MMRFLLFFVLLSAGCSAQHLVPWRNSTGWQLYNLSAKFFLPELYQEAIPAKTNLILLRKDNKWGAVDRSGRPVLPFSFDLVKVFKNGLLYALLNDTIFLYTGAGKKISSSYFLDAGDFKNDSSLVVVKVANKKYGLITSDGKPVVPFEYDYPPEHFSVKYLKIGKEKKSRPLFGLLDEALEIFIAVKYTDIEERMNHHFLCRLPNGKYDLFDEKGKLVWSGRYKVNGIYKDFFQIENKDKQGVLFRKNGKTVWFKNNCWVRPETGIVISNNESHSKNGFFRRDGSFISCPNQNLYSTGESTLYLKSTAEKKGQLSECTLIDLNGKKVLNTVFTVIKDFTNEYCVAGKAEMENGRYKQKFGILKISDGELLVPVIYDDIILFKKGYALRTEKYWKLYTLSGKRSNEFDYTEIENSAGHNHKLHKSAGEIPLFFVKRVVGKFENGSDKTLCGYIDEACNEVLASEYMDIHELKDRYGKVSEPSLFSFSKPDPDMPFSGYAALFDEKFSPLTDFKFTGFAHYWHPYIVFAEPERIDGEIRGLMGIMDTLGKIIVPSVFDKVETVHKNGFIGYRNGRTSFYSKSGKEIIKPHYQFLSFLNDTLLKAGLWDNECVFHINGEKYFEAGWYEILEAGFLEGTLIKVRSKNPARKEDYYIDFSGSEFRTVSGNE